MDVFTSRLAEALRSRGVDVETTWFPPAYELFPELTRLHPMPVGTDVIHANSWNASAFLQRGVPVVVTVHHLVHDPAYAPYRSWAQAQYHRWHVRWRERLAITRAAEVTAVSPYVAGTVRAVFGRQDIHVVPNWVDTQRYRPLADAQDSNRDGFRLLWVGNPSRRKGADLLPGLATALGAGYEIRCIGGLRNDAGTKRGVGLRWLGRLSEDQLIEEYQRCDALLSLSRYEGFGYTALEAMACGKPVVGFRAGGLADVVRHGATGFLEPVNDLDGLLARVRQLADDRVLRKRMGEAARDDVCGQPDPVDDYIRLYQRCSRSGVRG